VVFTLSTPSFEQVLTADPEALRRFFKLAKELSHRYFGSRIRFYAPGFIGYRNRFFDSNPYSFPSISVTGSWCSLNCLHCRAKILEAMRPALMPNALYEACVEVKEKGGLGCLISGGCLPDGSVPLDRFLDVIGRVKRDLKLTVVVHTGLVSRSTARKLAEAGVDAALIDVLGSDETIREVYGLKASVDDYDRSLDALKEAGVPIVPHVLVGLHYGKLKGEVKALELIAKHKPSAVIVIAFTPIRGTPMEDVEPPKPLDIAKVLVIARLIMPSTPIVLGCARPKGLHRVKTDCLAVGLGVNAIAFPSEEAVDLAVKLGLQVAFSRSCCSQAWKDYLEAS